MPYIAQDRRGAIWWSGSPPSTPGELNYFITMHALTHIQCKGRDQDLVATVLQAAGRYIDHNGKQGSLSYAMANDIVGAITCAALELDRRGHGEGVRPTASVLLAPAREFYDEAVAPYEDAKARENGDLPYPSQVAYR